MRIEAEAVRALAAPPARDAFARVALPRMRVYANILMSPPIPPCHCTVARRASRALTSLYDRFLAPVGLSLPQLSLLRNLERDGPQSVTALAGRVRLERTTLGRNLRVLEKARWVASRRAEDQRERVVMLTAAGRNVLARADPLWAQAQRSVEERLGPRRLAVLREVLARLEAAEA